MNTPDIPTLIASLRERQTDLGPLANCRSDTERSGWHRISTNLASTISQLQNPVDPRLVERIQHWHDKRDAWTTKEAELVASIHDHPDDTVQQRALVHLRRGNLACGHGATYGTLEGITVVIAELEGKRDQAQGIHAAAIARAVALVALEKVT